MPYIEPKQREFLSVTNAGASNAGQLNYEITLLIKKYMTKSGPLNYQTINDIVGALEGAKLEFVRRVVNPYEDTKIAANGDVYD